MSKVGRTTNPNGANQYHPDPRQDLFLASYLDPNSETWGNAYKSAIRAGFSETYAMNIKNQMPTWLLEKLDDTSILQQAIVNLKEFLTTDDEKLQVIRADMTKFSLKGLQKNKWSDRQEVTGKDGKDIIEKQFSEEERDKMLALINQREEKIVDIQPQQVI